MMSVHALHVCIGVLLFFGNWWWFAAAREMIPPFRVAWKVGLAFSLRKNHHADITVLKRRDQRLSLSHIPAAGASTAAAGSVFFQCFGIQFPGSRQQGSKQTIPDLGPPLLPVTTHS